MMSRNLTFTNSLSKRAAAALMCGAAIVAAPALAQEQQAEPQAQGAIGGQVTQQQPGPAASQQLGQPQQQFSQPQQQFSQPQQQLGQPQQQQLGQPQQQLGQPQQAQRGPQLGAQIEPHEDGIKIVRVRSESVAEKAGLKEGDIIKRFNDEEVSDIGTLQNQMRQIEAGDEVELVVMRDDEEETLTAKFEQMQADQDDRVAVARPALDQAGQSELEELRREVQQLREELKSMKEEHEAMKQEHEQLKERKQELREEAEQAQADDDNDND